MTNKQIKIKLRDIATQARWEANEAKADEKDAYAKVKEAREEAFDLANAYRKANTWASNAEKYADEVEAKL